MLYRVAADVVLVFHLVFVLYAIFGGLLVFRWSRSAYLHIPVVIWGSVIEVMGWVCPLTPIEIDLRHAAGTLGYSGSFIDHYVLPVLYPANLTRPAQWLLGLSLLLFNVVVYTLIYRSRRRPPASGA